MFLHFVKIFIRHRIGCRACRLGHAQHCAFAIIEKRAGLIFPDRRHLFSGHPIDLARGLGSMRRTIHAPGSSAGHIACHALQRQRRLSRHTDYFAGKPRKRPQDAGRAAHGKETVRNESQCLFRPGKDIFEFRRLRAINRRYSSHASFSCHSIYEAHILAYAEYGCYVLGTPDLEYAHD